MGFYSRVLFPWGMNKLMSGEPFDNERDTILKDVAGEVLEIGFGSGLNLSHYPACVTHLTAVEPNEGMNRYATQQIDNSPIEVECKQHSGESLPMEDASFDTVVSTWTLCSIPDIEQALAEVKRVLKPGGRFVFLEHGLSDEPAVQRWQQRLTPLQKTFGDGCHLNRDMRALIGDTGFTSFNIENFYLEKTPKILGYMYRGIAIR